MQSEQYLAWKSESVSHSVVSDSETPWTVTRQAPLPTEFSRKEYWSVLPPLLQKIFLIQGSNPGLLHCRQILYHLSHQGSPNFFTNLAVTQLLGSKELSAGTEVYLGRLMGINYQISAFLSIGFIGDFWTIVHCHYWKMAFYLPTISL